MESEVLSPPPEVPVTPTTWAQQLFPDSVAPPSSLAHRQFYMGEDNEERYPGIDELFMTHSDSEAQPPPFGPRVDISKDKYLSLFQKWRGALIVKLLGKSISYRVFDQKIRDLWQLELGYELTDMAEGFYVVCFFSRRDYLHVLEDGPWVILGHYLTVMKWRPKFWPTA